MPALPGAHHSFVTSGDAAIFHARACSRPPEPSRRIFIGGARSRIVWTSVGRTNLLGPARGGPNPSPVIPGCALLGAGPESITTIGSMDSGLVLRTPRNARDYLLPPDAAMISCSVATWRAKAPRPVAVAVTVVCGFLPTKALSTAT